MSKADELFAKIERMAPADLLALAAGGVKAGDVDTGLLIARRAVDALRLARLLRKP